MSMGEPPILQGVSERVQTSVQRSEWRAQGESNLNGDTEAKKQKKKIESQR